jgi:hypothetical protein
MLEGLLHHTNGWVSVSYCVFEAAWQGKAQASAAAAAAVSA